MDIKNSLNCDDWACSSKNFEYDASCYSNHSCFIRAHSLKGGYELYYQIMSPSYSSDRSWKKECWIYKDEAEYICRSLEGQGWFVSDER